MAARKVYVRKPKFILFAKQTGKWVATVYRASNEEIVLQAYGSSKSIAVKRARAALDNAYA